MRGHPASPGIAIGPIATFHSPPIEVPDGDAADVDAELQALDTALAATATAVAAQRSAIVVRAGAQEAEIFDAHLLFLRDDAILGPARAAIRDDHASAAQAWRAAIDHTVSQWDGLDDPYLRARAADLDSIGDQVLAHIVGVELSAPQLTTEGILVAADLTPADTAAPRPHPHARRRDGTRWSDLARGGPRSIPGHPGGRRHRSGVLDLDEGTTVVLDGDVGSTHRSTRRRSTLAQHRDRTRSSAGSLREAHALAEQPAVTIGRDGDRSGRERRRARTRSRPAVAAGADGVGLFRTEFLFMDRASVPMRTSRCDAYRAAAEALEGRPLLLRTLDAGADKPIPYLDQPAEPNPFLGVRGVRLGLARPELLRTQLRAVLRVAQDHPRAGDVPHGRDDG